MNIYGEYLKYGIKKIFIVTSISNEYSDLTITAFCH